MSWHLEMSIKILLSLNMEVTFIFHEDSIHHFILLAEQDKQKDANTKFYLDIPSCWSFKLCCVYDTGKITTQATL